MLPPPYEDEIRRGSRLNLASSFRHGGRIHRAHRGERKHRAFGRKPSSPTSYKTAATSTLAARAGRRSSALRPFSRAQSPPRRAGVQILLSYLYGKCLYIIPIGRCQGVVCVSMWLRRPATLYVFLCNLTRPAINSAVSPWTGPSVSRSSGVTKSVGPTPPASPLRTPASTTASW
jgi:hypothetical protein